MGVDEIRSLYAGRVEEKPHKYVEGGKYLGVEDISGGKGKLVFATEGDGRFTSWRVGVPPQVDYVEGCSWRLRACCRVAAGMAGWAGWAGTLRACPRIAVPLESGSHQGWRSRHVRSNRAVRARPGAACAGGRLHRQGHLGAGAAHGRVVVRRRSAAAIG